MDEALTIAKQVADASEAAPRRGVHFISDLNLGT